MFPASRVAVVYNPVKPGTDAIRRHAVDRAHRHGWTDPVFIETTIDDPGAGQAAEAAASGVGLVIACGGDGTVRSVARGLIGTGVPMGVVPTGTGNLLARNLDIPLDDVDAAFATAMAGRSRLIDLGEVLFTDADGAEHEDVFLVMLGTGMDAELVAGADDALKAKVGWIAYVGSFTRAVLRGHRIKTLFTVGSGPKTYSRTRTLLVANCGRLQAGMVLVPDAVIDDGKLDVLTLGVKGPVAWIRAAGALTAHTVLHRVPALRKLVVGLGRARRMSEPMEFSQGARMAATVLDGPAAFQIDGEDAGTVTAFEASIKHRALTVRVGL